jgi:hypothetical protein
MEEITVPLLDRAQRIVDYWAAKLGMADWGITVIVARDLSGETGTCHSALNYDRAVIEVQPWVIGLGDPPGPDTTQDWNIANEPVAFEAFLVHEVLHAFMRRRSRAAERIRSQLPEPVRDAYRDMANDADEEIVDRLARVLVSIGSYGDQA